MLPARGLVRTYSERLRDITAAVQKLRQHGVQVSFPMQTASGEIIFALGNDLILTAEQLLALLDRGELHPEGVLRLAGMQPSVERPSVASIPHIQKKAASSS